MKPVEFPEANSTLGGGPGKKWGLENGNVVGLPVFRGEGRIISCWQPSLAERLNPLFGGKVWLTVLVFERREIPGQVIEAAEPQGEAR